MIWNFSGVSLWECQRAGGSGRNSHTEELSFCCFCSVSRAPTYLWALKLATHIGNKKDKCLHVKNKVLCSGLKIKDRILSYCSFVSFSLESYLTEFLHYLKTVCSENLLSFYLRVKKPLLISFKVYLKEQDLFDWLLFL